MANVTEYRPSYVKLPAGYKKDFTDYPDQLKFQQKNADYDADSLFYDVFYDIKRENIWAVGPPLYSLDQEFAAMEIFADGERLAYSEHPDSKHSRSIRIPLPADRREVTKLEIVIGATRTSVPVSRFPAPTKVTEMTLSVIQKDYSLAHIRDWLLWHYRLYGFRRILLYDNGSADAAELLRSLRALDAPLAIVLIHWPYYWGHKIAPFTDAFAQYTQLNHTHRLHYGASCPVANWDIDEYLVCRSRTYFRVLRYWRSLHIDRYDGLGDGGGGIGACDKLVRGLYNDYDRKKYLYITNTVTAVQGVHHIGGWLTRRPSLLFRVRSRLFVAAIRGWERLARYVGRPRRFYLIHALFLRQMWSEEQRERLAAQSADDKEHLSDLYGDFQRCLERAKWDAGA